VTTATPLVDALGAFPSETTSAFAFAARDLLASTNISRAALRSVVEDGTLPDAVRFNAFYCLQVAVWRERDFMEYRVNLDTYRTVFDGHPMLQAQIAQYYLSRSAEQHDLSSALRYADLAMTSMPYASGVLNLFGEVVSRICETDAALVDAATLTKAIEATDRAIAATDARYARYFGTRARLRSQLGEFRQAQADVDRAIEIEDSGSSAYALRIGEYQLTRMNINLLQQSRISAQQQDRLQETIDRARDELISMRAQYLELLGLLVAVMAFIFSTINLTGRFDARETASVLLTMTGLILIVFAGFGLQIASGRSNRLATTYPLALGIVACGLGFGLLYHSP
jgi:hypothetical protein